ncbi:hypothetical protein [Candidatus Caldatribacterium saccharofermentans]|uniref:hypothetical protein n=1 Tax=Candidatus Caldatribacterium saccharofermentans TaxID=1454753 RepID=UPI003D03E842
MKCVPYLTGDRTSLVQKKASFSGLTLDTTREECLRALVGGIVGRMRKTLDMMSERLTLHPTMVVTGGAGSALLEYKRRVFRDFEIELKENCSILGCMEIARRFLRQGR